MKRIALLTVLLLVVGLSLGFAQEFKPSITTAVAGSASLTWGIDLDTMETGFTNAGSGTFTMTLIPAVTLTKGADAPVYGWISLAFGGITLTQAGGATAGGGVTVVGKIVAKPVEIGIYNDNSGALGKAYVIENSANSTDLVGVLNTADAALSTSVGAGATAVGTYVSYVSDMLTITGNLLGRNDWATRGADTITDYDVGADVKLVFAPVTVTTGYWQSLVTGSTGILYGTVALAAVGPLTAGVQVDVDLATPTAFDLGATVGLALTAKTKFDVWVNYGDTPTFDGIDVKAKFATTEVAGLSETLTAYVLDIAAPSAAPLRYVVDNVLSYAVAMDPATITPSLQVQYGMDAAAASHLKAIAKVTIAGAIPNTTFVLTYTSSDFMVTGDVSGNTVTFATTVAY